MADLSLTVLGCSGSFAAAGQACSGYLVQSADTKIWVDCGPGTLGNLQHHIALSEVDAIVVSHHHPDHCAELPVVYNAYKYFTGVDRVRVIATNDVKRVTDSFQSDGDSGDVFSWELVHDGTTTRVGDIEIKFSRTDHPVETLAMRLTSESNSIIYTSDTGPGWSMSDLGAEPDIVIGRGPYLTRTHTSRSPISVAVILPTKQTRSEPNT